MVTRTLDATFGSAAADYTAASQKKARRAECRCSARGSEECQQLRPLAAAPGGALAVELYSTALYFLTSSLFTLRNMSW